MDTKYLLLMFIALISCRTKDEIEIRITNETIDSGGLIRPNAAPAQLNSIVICNNGRDTLLLYAIACCTQPALSQELIRQKKLIKIIELETYHSKRGWGTNVCLDRSINDSVRFVLSPYSCERFSTALFLSDEDSLHLMVPYCKVNDSNRYELDFKLGIQERGTQN